MNYYTYIYYDPSRSNEPIYVGKGKGDRAWSHLKRSDSSLFPNRLRFMNKLGIYPIIGVYGGLDEEFALFLEEELIQHFGRKNLNEGPLLNLTDGGESNAGYEFTYKDRAKISSALKGMKKSTKHCDKIGDMHRGKIISDEVKSKISKSCCAIMTPEKKAEISQKTKESMTTEHRKLLSERAKARQYSIVECPHCGKLGKINSMKRHHFDKCKDKVLLT